MMEHLGGAQTPEMIRDAHTRFLAAGATGTGQMFTIALVPQGDVVGAVGYWERTLADEVVYETGWDVFPEYQGQGLASQAAALAIERARSESKHRFLHAFPQVDNAPSNAICRKLGFELLGAFDFEYPPGNPLRCNDWRLDLFDRGEGLPGPR